MSARVKQQIGYSLLGAVMLVIGIAGNVGDVSNESVRIVCSAAGLCGVVLLVVNFGGLVLDLVRGDD